MRERLGWTGPVHIVPNGVNVDVPARAGRSPVPRLVCVGRLVAHKRVALLLDAVEELRERWPGLIVKSVAPLLGEVIQRIHTGISVGAMFPEGQPQIGRW